MAKKPETEDQEDVLLMGPDLGDDTRPFYRQNSEGVHAGFMRPLKEGQPLPENAFAIEHRGPGPVFNVHPLTKGHSRPATTSYRNGWDRIFGGKQPVGQA